MALSARRVVVTGLGLVTPLGIGVQQTWSKLIAGDCGVVSLKDLPAPNGLPGFETLPSQVGAVVKREGGQALGGFDSTEWLDRGVRATSPPPSFFPSLYLHLVPAYCCLPLGITLSLSDIP